MIEKRAAIELWGTTTRLATALGVHASTIAGWPNELSTRQQAQILGISLLKKGLQKCEAYFGGLPR